MYHSLEHRRQAASISLKNCRRASVGCRFFVNSTFAPPISFTWSNFALLRQSSLDI